MFLLKAPQANAPADDTMVIVPASRVQAECSIHGRPTKRSTCRSCNAAYMRGYLQQRRQNHPEVELLARAQKRASRLGVEFALSEVMPLPTHCPALGITLTPGGRRRDSSPSLDRIDPAQGYVPGNVRIISDRANRLKGNRSLEQLKALAVVGASAQRADFALVGRYVEREAVLAEVRRRAETEAAPGEWAKLANFLDQALAKIGAPPRG